MVEWYEVVAAAAADAATAAVVVAAVSVATFAAIVPHPYAEKAISTVTKINASTDGKR